MSPLRPDSLLLQQLQEDPSYDYSRDIVQVEQESLLDWLSRVIGQWLDKVFSSKPMETMGTWFWPTMAGILLLLVVAFVYWRRRSLFTSAGKRTEALDDPDEDTIYGIDFAQAIGKARDKRQWNEVLRLTYLQTMKALSDASLIDWQPHKTPTQYLREVSTDAFRIFTNNFLRVRYGGFMADEALCNEMQALQTQIEKGGGI